MAKQKFKKLNIEYQEINAYSEVGREICNRLNIMSAGTILDNKDNIIDIKEIN
jgi:ABC-type oligopeptide transport system ATPase subunit